MKVKNNLCLSSWGSVLYIEIYIKIYVIASHITVHDFE